MSFFSKFFCGLETGYRMANKLVSWVNVLCLVNLIFSNKAGNKRIYIWGAGLMSFAFKLHSFQSNHHFVIPGIKCIVRQKETFFLKLSLAVFLSTCIEIKSSFLHLLTGPSEDSHQNTYLIPQIYVKKPFSLTFSSWISSAVEYLSVTRCYQIGVTMFYQQWQIVPKVYHKISENTAKLFWSNIVSGRHSNLLPPNWLTASTKLTAQELETERLSLDIYSVSRILLAEIRRCHENG